MFNLETAVAKWRNGLAAVATTLQLDELENHLREEIERQAKAGLDEREAFELAVKKIGHARALKVEFRKVGLPVAARFVRLAGLACGFIAGVWLLWMAYNLLTIHEATLIERIGGFVAIALASLSWRYGGRILPVIPRQRIRTAIGFLSCVAGVGGITFFIKSLPQLLNVPAGTDIPVGGLLVAFVWAWAAAAMLAAVAYRLEDAARKNDDNMLNLERAIADWRKQMHAGGMESPAPLEELENHLREDIGNLMAAGQPVAEAFQIAAARVGNPGNVGAEFKKTEPRHSAPVVIGSLAWFGAAVLCLVLLLGRSAEGRLSLLLTAHVFSLTIGYVTVFLAGAFGIYATCRRRFGSGRADEAMKLSAAIRWFTQISAGLVVVGFILGMIWSNQNRGTFFGRDPREFGGLGAAIWLVASVLIQRLKATALAESPLPAQLGIIGNIIIGVAWFGAGAMAHGYPAGSYLPLNLLLGAHFFFLGMTVMPGHKPGRNIIET